MPTTPLARLTLADWAGSTKTYSAKAYAGGGGAVADVLAVDFDRGVAIVECWRLQDAVNAFHEFPLTSCKHWTTIEQAERYPKDREAFQESQRIKSAGPPVAASVVAATGTDGEVSDADAEDGGGAVAPTPQRHRDPVRGGR